MTTERTAINHFQSMATLLTQLVEEGIFLTEHSYHAQSSDSFEILLKKGRQRLKFVWNGKDFILSVSFSKALEDHTSADWVHDADFSLPAGEGVYSEIASQAVGMFHS